jgi:hypothetical protein
MVESLWFRGDILTADSVLTNSHGTAERLRTMVGAQVSGVVLPGVTPRFQRSRSTGKREIAESLSRLGVKPPYLLSVATPEPQFGNLSRPRPRNVRLFCLEAILLKSAS